MGGVLLKTARWFGVTFGVILLTSFTVDATLNNGSISQSALGILALKAVESGCPKGTAHFTDGARQWCMDTYEISPGGSCPNEIITNAVDTTENMSNAACQPESTAGANPWVFVSYHQAQELCAKRGMRLPSHDEWYTAAVGTPDSDAGGGCNLSSSGVHETGAEPSCVSPGGMYDMLGNVWEWIDADVVNGQYADRTLPESGYVSDADSAGVAITTTQNEITQFHKDYFWSQSEGSFGMIRGGFYGSDTDGGLYSIQAQVARSFIGDGIGFRCVKDV